MIYPSFSIFSTTFVHKLDWHVDMNEKKDSLKCWKHVKKIPKDELVKSGEVACNIFGYTEDNCLIDYWEGNHNSWNDLPEVYRKYLQDVKKEVGFRDIIVLLTKNGQDVNNVIRSNNDTKSVRTIKSTDGWLSANHIKNYMLDDSLMDYIETHRNEVEELLYPILPPISKRRRCGSSSSSPSSMDEIMSGFKDKTICKLIDEFLPDFHNADHNYSETIMMVNNKVPIIHKPRLVDETLEVFSDVDLLVRYDFIPKIAQEINPPAFRRGSAKDVYVPVILTMKKISLKADKVHACKFGKYILTEGLLCLANEMLSRIQGGNKVGTGGYVLSREHVLARVDPPPQVLEKVMKAIEWRKLASRVDGGGLSLFPRPNNPNLYPNMKTDNNDRLKVKYAETIGELTQLAFITSSIRDRCIDVYKIDSIDHPEIHKVIPKDIGVKGAHSQNYVSNIFQAQGIKTMKILCKPVIIEEDFDAYIDFETFYDFNRSRTQPYMFGLWSRRKKSYTCVVLDGTSDENIDQFWYDVKKVVKKYRRLASWGVVEKHLLDNSPNCIGDDVDIINLCEVASECGLQIPKMKNYKLKEIGRCLRLAGLTKMEWNELGSGIDAMTHAMSHYLHGRAWNLEMIMKYNEVDCKILQVISDLLRSWNVVE